MELSSQGDKAHRETKLKGILSSEGRKQSSERKKQSSLRKKESSQGNKAQGKQSSQGNKAHWKTKLTERQKLTRR